MENFTYEVVDRKEQYETYEWDNTWINLADTCSENRVLYIGDSISCGTRNIATEQTNRKILFDGFGTSKAVDNPYFFESIKLFASQQQTRKAVIYSHSTHNGNNNF